MLLFPKTRPDAPKQLIPAFPGTNCAYRAVTAAGAEARIEVIRNLTSSNVARNWVTVARKNAINQVIFLSGCLSGSDEPEGRVFGKMGHSERIGRNLYRNVPGSYDIRMFEAAVKYFR